ncbi:MAG: c-type cytochrome [Candidatus Longimicrobiales bacterium M2_2A_002]
MGEMHRRMMGGEPGNAPEATARRASAADCPDIDQALVDRGRAVFNGSGGCTACHGRDATGTALAPDLSDAEWLNGDGSYGTLVGLVRSGVPQPRRYPAPMPPMGGAELAEEHVCAAAAYVYSLSP